MKVIINFLLFQACWFSCVLGAASGFPLLGPICSPLSVLIQNVNNKNWKNELLFILSLTLIGSSLDAVLVFFDFYSFPSNRFILINYPIWMIALWGAFATLFSSSLLWMRGRYFLSFLFGAVGGPVAYYGGVKFGALYVNGIEGYLGIAVLWSLITPFALWLSKKLS